MTITQEMVLLGATARRLNAGSDQLNHILKKIDTVLGQLMIGIDHLHPRPIEEHSSTDEAGKRVIEMSYLGYLRTGGGFHLAIKTTKVLESRRSLATEQPGRVVPLLSATRSQRHAAVDALPALISGLAGQVSEIAEKMTQRCEVASGLLDYLEDMLVDQEKVAVLEERKARSMAEESPHEATESSARARPPTVIIERRGRRRKTQPATRRTPTPAS